MGRPPCCDKSNVKRGLWTADEDAKMLAHVSKYGIGNWTSVPKKAGLNRCGKSCRLRWTNYLKPDLKHDNFTPQEEELIINLHQAIGSRWSLIAKRLPGRTDNDVKNYWNTKLKKKLSKMGIDHVTHKPFSQILSDYGDISGLPNSGHNIATFDRNLDNIFLTKPEPSSCITGFPATNMITINPSSDFLSHFQVINQENNMIPPHFFNEVTSSCSSSSSSHVNDLSTAQTVTPSSSCSPMNWTEFLINQEQDLLDLKANGMGDEVSNYSPSCEFGSAINGAQRSCNNKPVENPSVNSFVDSILDQDSQLREAFPEFLYDSFEYF